MKESKLCIAYTKSFEVKPQLARHFDPSNPKFKGAYVTICAKLSQIFSTASTYEIIIS